MTIVRNIDVLDSPDPFDVCIIGSGFSGSVLATSLVSQGVRTLMLESGGNLLHWGLSPRLRKLAAYRVSGDTEYPTERTKARALGGNSNFWTGRCERFHPSDFSAHQYTPRNNPWPITYAELEPYYEKAEQTLRVRGNSLSKYTAPRNKGLPLDSRSDISGLKLMLVKADVTLDESPTATPRKAVRFFRVQKELLPSFLASRRGSLVSGVTATRLLSGSERRITGVEVQTLDGTTKFARAKIYVVACGGIETPRLLLLSRSEAFPKGIGNTYDKVGRGFNEHPGVNFYGQLRHSRNTIIPRHKIGRCHQFYDKFRNEKLGSVLPVFIQSWVFPNHLVAPKFSHLHQYVAAALSRIARPTLYIGATVEMLPTDDNRVTLDKQAKDCFGNPLAHLSFNFSEEDHRILERTRTLISDIYGRLGAEQIEESEMTWSRHHIGTARMGDNPGTSVTDRQLRVHECPNLYLCGSETFVTGAAVPPVLTIVALAHRLSDQLVARLKQG